MPRTAAPWPPPVRRPRPRPGPRVARGREAAGGAGHGGVGDPGRRVDVLGAALAPLARGSGPVDHLGQGRQLDRSLGRGGPRVRVGGEEAAIDEVGQGQVQMRGGLAVAAEHGGVADAAEQVELGDQPAAGRAREDGVEDLEGAGGFVTPRVTGGLEHLAEGTPGEEAHHLPLADAATGAETVDGARAWRHLGHGPSPRAHPAPRSTTTRPTAATGVEPASTLITRPRCPRGRPRWPPGCGRGRAGARPP